VKIYIASSWKNQHAVEMLTDCLRGRDHEVLSFVENNHNEGHSFDKSIPFDEWIKTEQAANSFRYDINAAASSELVIYIGPSGTDAWAEVGIAFASNADPAALTAKNTDAISNKLDQVIANTAPGDGTKRAIEGAS